MAPHKHLGCYVRRYSTLVNNLSLSPVCSRANTAMVFVLFYTMEICGQTLADMNVKRLTSLFTSKVTINFICQFMLLPCLVCLRHELMDIFVVGSKQGWVWVVAWMDEWI